MPPPTISTLPRITRDQLSTLLLTHPPPTSLAIIDVRDTDHIGGHIRGSTNVPAPTLDYRIPELVRTLRDREMVVFHCALSQQRGPGAALRYLRERERVGGEGEGEGGKMGKGQRVVVLDGGFVRWQEKYGEDERLTEGYRKDVWAFGY